LAPAAVFRDSEGELEARILLEAAGDAAPEYVVLVNDAHALAVAHRRLRRLTPGWFGAGWA
jgi:hypothetical protein